MIDNAILQAIRPVFSGHETFPMRYGWLKKVFDACTDIEKQKDKTIVRDLFNADSAIVTLGVGKNMVASMKHWSIYSSLLELDKDKNLSIDKFARKIFKDDGYDPFLENYATLWYIHWNLVRFREKESNLFTYVWFFNFWNGGSFDKETLTKRILEVIKDCKLKEPSTATLKRDIECFIALYVTKTGKYKLNEESIESPLTELELISPITRRDLFQINKGIKPTLSIYTFLFGLFKFWDYYSPNSKTLSFESICYESMSPGRIFLINEDAVAGYMQDISKVTDGALDFTETAGMKQILLHKDINLEKSALQYFKRNYK
jgi:hypothetical protein